MAWHQHNDKWYSSQYFTFEVELCKDVVVEGLSELDDACRKVAERNSKPSMEIALKRQISIILMKEGMNRKIMLNLRHGWRFSILTFNSTAHFQHKPQNHRCTWWQ